ncbi:MAG: reverse transcriptase family protein [Sedimenticola sp.]
MTWNATGIMSSSSYLCDVLTNESVDVCGVSEHWLFEYNIHFMNGINSNYISIAKSDSDLSTPSCRRIGKGGVGLLWKRQYDACITPIDIDDDRIIGIQFEVSKSVYMYIFQIYLPCSNHPISTYRDYLDSIHALVCMYKERGVVIMMGDYNAHLNGSCFIKPLDSRGRDLSNFLVVNNLVSVNTLDVCVGAESTFVSYDESYESLIDHIVIGAERLDTVVKCQILDDSALNVSRHRPVLCVVSLPAPSMSDLNSDGSSPQTNWNKASDYQLWQYREVLTEMMRERLTFPLDCVSNQEVDMVYNTLVQCMCASSDVTIPKSKFKYFLKPYWNRDLTVLHNEMKTLRNLWIGIGRPRGREHESFQNYKDAKRNFRAAHRRCVEVYEQTLLSEIDTAAELDSRQFWKLFNSRRKQSCTSPGAEIKFDDVTCRDSESIALNWGNYFEKLYTPQDEVRYDADHSIFIGNEINQYKINILNENMDSSVPVAIITPEEVRSAVKLCKRGKAGADDNVVYEHIIHGGDYLCTILADFYTNMIKLSHTPADMKQGIIITLHKGGRKRKDDPNNYRGITLSSCLLKLYERLLLHRIHNADSDQISALQGGFQKGFSCVMTSYLLRECMSYAKEQGSKLYVCFLDTQKAFDKVWHDGLFFKLRELGINSAEFKAIMDMYDGMNSCVRYKNFRSHSFKVLQGTRQGGVISPFFYLIYIDSLLRELEISNRGVVLYENNCSSPTVADDMVLVSYSKSGLQHMMDICYRYSCKWRYKYNGSKCSVIVFHESKNDYVTSNRQWNLGNDSVEEAVNYTHLGIICNKYLDSKQNVMDAAVKIRATFMCLINSGIHKQGLHPMTAKKIYERIVLPKALYGCELWNNILPADTMLLERAHRMCIKYIQGLPKRTRTDIAVSLLGSYSLEAEIDRSKLRFLGQLIAISTDRIVKRVFVNRLIAYLTSPSASHGFISDIYRILLKYGLLDYLIQFKEAGMFPTKAAWKIMVNTNIHEHEISLWNSRTDVDTELTRFKDIHQSLEIFGLWKLSVGNSKVTSSCKSAVYLIAKMYSDTRAINCGKCGLCTDNIIVHYIYFCTHSENLRHVLWRQIIDKCGMHVFNQFTELSIERQIHVICSASHLLEITPAEMDKLTYIGIEYLHRVKQLFRVPTFT